MGLDLELNKSVKSIQIELYDIAFTIFHNWLTSFSQWTVEINANVNL